MKLVYKAAGIFLLLFSVFSFAQQPQLSQNNGINQSINQTAAYISIVNQSGYLLFSPNLTTAYSDLSEAQNVSRSNPAQALALLAEAHQSAQQQLQYLDSEKNTSFTVLAIITVVLAIALYYVMRRDKKAASAEKMARGRKRK
jgi:hypothetical protein